MMPDGRLQRAARHREEILDAMCELIRESHEAPTFEAVAQRAGVSRRTVFRQFDDLESLYRAVSERVLTEVLDQVRPAPLCGELERDLRGLVRRRAQIFELIAPFRHAGRTLRAQSEFLQQREERVRLMFRDAVERALGPHLQPGDDDALQTLDLLLSFETWDRLRFVQRCTANRAERLLLKACRAVVSSSASALA